MTDKEHYLTNVTSLTSTNGKPINVRSDEQEKPTGADPKAPKMPSQLSAYLSARYGLSPNEVYYWKADHDYDRYRVMLKDGAVLIVTGMDIYRQEHREVWG